jgi:hypothetical protein
VETRLCGQKIQIDEEDYRLVKDSCWIILKVNGNIAFYKYPKPGNKIILLNRYLCNVDVGDKRIVLHKNKNPLDFRKSNLEITNRIGYKKEDITNQTGVKGVSWKEDRKRYRVILCINGKAKHIGYYKTIDEATRAYREAEKATVDNQTIKI